MQTTHPRQADIMPWHLADAAIDQVRTRSPAASKMKPDASSQQLARGLQAPNGLDITVGTAGRVIRPGHNATAAEAWSHIADEAPHFLPWHLQPAIRAGGKLADLAPGVVVPTDQAALRALVGHLVIDSRDNQLGKAIQKIRTPGIDLNINLLGEAILGQQEADKRVADTLALIARDDVDYVSVKVSATVAPHNHWAHDEAV